MTGRRNFLRQTGGLLLLGSLGSAASIGCGGSSGGGTPEPTPPPLPDIPPAPTPASPTPGQEWTNPKDGSVLIWVPGGTFQMGTNDEGSLFRGARPVHTVTLSGFWMGKYEVTYAQFKRYATETGVVIDEVPGFYPENRYYDNDPIGGNWVDAMGYANWAGLTLPTEAQWEYAATGGDSRRYPWGNDWDPSRCSNAVIERPGRPSSVGSYPTGVSPFGMHDMAGNAWEWCRDWAGDYSSVAQTNPTGPSTGTVKILRGASYFSSLQDQFRCAVRTATEFNSGSSDVGFRMASRG